MRGRILVLTTAAVLCAGTGFAQPRESIAIGGAGSVGVLGNVSAIRVSGAAAERWAIDLTVGRVDGHGSPTSSGLGGPSFAAQVRWLWRGRGTSGASGYWIGGPMVQMGTDRTEIRWPDGSRDVRTERVANATLQVGYGWDKLTANGARFGVELTTGGNERGPTTMVMMFAVWGPPKR